MAELSGKRCKILKKMDHPSIVQLFKVRHISLQRICFVYELLNRWNSARRNITPRIGIDHFSSFLEAPDLVWAALKVCCCILSQGLVVQCVHITFVVPLLGNYIGYPGNSHMKDESLIEKGVFTNKVDACRGGNADRWQFRDWRRATGFPWDQWWNEPWKIGPWP